MNSQCRNEIRGRDRRGSHRFPGFLFLFFLCLAAAGQPGPHPGGRTLPEGSQAENHFSATGLPNPEIPQAALADTLPSGKECTMVIPNGFSPNGDGIQDYFRITCMEHYPDAVIRIFNRWGNVVYKKGKYGNLSAHGEPGAWWDGTSNQDRTLGGTSLASGTYFYILDLMNGSKPVTGSVFLFR